MPRNASSQDIARPSFGRRVVPHSLFIGLIALATLTAGATMGDKPSDIHQRIERGMAAPR